MCDSDLFSGEDDYVPENSSGDSDIYLDHIESQESGSWQCKF